jgi:hypothetical protein
MQLPSFLHGSRSTAHSKVVAEGRRCARQYQKNGSFTLPREMLELAPGEVVSTYGGSDFQQHLPAWRLYLLSDVEMSLCEALEHGNWRQAEEQYEAFFRETAWGALYYATAEKPPESAERTAQRLQAVLRSWGTLETARYHYKKPGAILDLGEFLGNALDWVLEGWCPEGGASVRARLEVAAARMDRASREDCEEVILRRLPWVFQFAEQLQHPETVTDMTFWRERLPTLDAESFERISAASPVRVTQLLYQWDRQLSGH